MMMMGTWASKSDSVTLDENEPIEILLQKGPATHLPGLGLL